MVRIGRKHVFVLYSYGLYSSGIDIVMVHTGCKDFWGSEVVPPQNCWFGRGALQLTWPGTDLCLTTFRSMPTANAEGQIKSEGGAGKVPGKTRL